MAEMSDAEVFGGGATSTPRSQVLELSDDDVFGGGAAPMPRAMSDSDIGLVDRPSNPGILDYLGEVGKSVVRGGAATLGAEFKGVAGQIYEPDTTSVIPPPPPGGYQTAEQVPELRTLPVAESTPYRIGEAIESGVAGALPDRDILNPIVRDVAGGVGSLGVNLASVVIPGVRAVALPGMIAQGAGEATERAVKAGATEDQVRRAASFGNISGATEFADVLLLNLGSTGKALGLLSRIGLKTAQGAFIEGGQEGLQQFIQNVIAKGVYNPKQDLTEDVAYNALIGAIVGGGAANIMPERQATTTPPTQETIAASAAPIGTPPIEVAPAPTASTEAPTVAPTAPAAPAPAEGMPRSVLSDPAFRDYMMTNFPPLETPPTTTEAAAKNLPAEHVAFMQGEVERLTKPESPELMKFDDLIGPIDVSLSPQREEIRTTPGADEERLADLLSQHLYGDMKSVAPVSVKEMFQNGFDAIKGFLEQNPGEQGNVDIKMDPKKRVISVHDDGLGMPASVMGKEFLTIAGTKKETKRASGGHGIAKMQFLFGSKNLRARSLRNGQYAELNTSGEELRTALVDKSKAPSMTIRPATAEDRKLFPKGHGTLVEVTIPETYEDPTTGDTKTIDFPSDPYYHPSLRKSPLFDNINVSFNGEQLPIGINFPLEDYTPLLNLNFDWGTARVYMTKEPRRQYGANAHVLSNGLWQFSVEVKRNPGDWASDNIPYTLYVDVDAKVESNKPGYPFSLNRQDFSQTTKKEFGKLFNYISLMYQRAGLEESAANFGSMQYLDYDPATKGVKATPNIKIEPKSPPPPTAITLLNPGDKIRVEDGKWIIGGREVPELTPQMIEEFRINPAELRVDQSEIDARRVILHDNIDIEVSAVETRSVTEYGRERFGKRFDEFVFAIGNRFKELRDVAARYATNKPKDPLEQVPFGVRAPPDYSDILKVGVGVSFDQEYRGVSIKIPFEGMFINPVVPQSTDPIEAAVDLTITMIHEIAHHFPIHRDHKAPWRTEFQRLLRVFETTPSFNFLAFKQKMVDTLVVYQDVFDHMNGVFTSGNFNIRNRGKRFEDSSSDETRNGEGTSDLARFGREPESGKKLSDWVAKGQTIPPTESGRSDPAFQTGPSRSTRPSDNGRARNYSALRDIDPGITAPPQQPEISPIREGTEKVLGSSPKEVKEAAAHADRFNWFYKFFAGVTELLDANPNFNPLRKYVERVRDMHSDETTIHDAALRLMKDWRRLGEQGKNLEALILDIQAMPYISVQERKMQLWRHPTAAEFGALVAKHRVSEEALKVYNRIREMDEKFLRLVEQNAVEQAKRKITDPRRLADRIDEIRVYGRLARSQPFFPFTHFGRYFVYVKDPAGKFIHFETFEPKRFGGVTIKRAEKYQQARIKELERKVPPGHEVKGGVLPETAGPLIGMPTLLLQQMQGEDIGLTSNQIVAIQQLQQMRNPAMSLNQRAEYKPSPIPGYSLDLQRSFARYYFYGGRYFARVKHAWGLRGNIAEAQLSPGNKAGLIASYMGDHLQHTILDARGDFGFFKGAIFLWAMGYVPAAATQNLTQTPMITFPFLSAKFNEIKASRALVAAMGQVSSFYRRGTYDNMTGFEMQALSYGIKTGRISETQAPELAGLASGGNLITGQGGTPTQRAAVAFQEKAAWMFEMAEQFNRRVAFRAALKLALENPKRKFVDESVKKYQDEYRALVAEFGGNEAQARAVVTAIHTVDQTQYVYARYARPRFMRGPLAGTLFVFKRYIQATLLMLGHNKADVLPRYVIIAMLMGGLGGVPGYDDVVGVFKAFAKWFFGKDVSVEKLVRHYVLQWFNGQVEPDLVLHGLARRGFGIPAITDLMGSFVTGNSGRGLSSKPAVNVPYPILDRSRAITMGNILPVDIGKMMEPSDKLDKTIADQAQKASGAVFSVGFNIYKALMDTHMKSTDPKRWERAVPRAFGSVSRSYRAFTEGRERGRGMPNSAPTIVPYDIRDTEQMMEALALAGGYQPLRQQAKWDLIIASAEAKAFYDFRRKALLEQYFEATKGQNPNEISKVRQEIIQFNTGLPDFAKPKAITGDTIRRSMSGRERTLRSRESGVPIQKSDIGISREMQRLFPEATIDVRRVR